MKWYSLYTIEKEKSIRKERELKKPTLIVTIKSWLSFLKIAIFQSLLPKISFDRYYIFLQCFNPSIHIRQTCVCVSIFEELHREY